MGQFRFILWMAYWYFHSKKFDFQWDAGNIKKSLIKHGVDVLEVESVFELKLAVPIGEQVSPPVKEQRLCVVGPSHLGRLVSVVFTFRDGKVRPISSRVANKRERIAYEKIRKETETIR